VPATIAQGGQEAEVECAYEVIPPAWHGEFRGALAGWEPEPGDAELRLAGGKVGQIIINQVFSGTGEGRFQGSGPPPG
jgi:hypothetical protein